jgi:DNA-binding NtrC family response regulator
VTQVDVRIVAATNRDLKERVKEGKFREDLYYRLSVIPIVMPPLREHRKSIQPLALYYLSFLNRQIGRDMQGYTDQALQAMDAYPWPGNVRELRNTVERGVLLAQGELIDVADLSLPGVSEDEGGGGDAMEPMSLADCEKKLIRTVLDSVDGNKNKAAEILKIHRTTLYKKIEEYGLGK